MGKDTILIDDSCNTGYKAKYIFRHLKRGCGKIGFATAPSLIHLKGELKLLHHTALTVLSEENTSKSEE